MTDPSMSAPQAQSASGHHAACRALDEHRRLRGQPIRLARSYALASVLWLIGSDVVFEWWVPHDRWRLGYLFLKGVLLAGVSAWLIFVLLRRANAGLLTSLATLDQVARGYTLLAEDLPTPCLLVDRAADIIVDINESAARLYGWRREALCGKPLGLLLDENLSRSSREQQHFTRDGGVLQVQVFRAGLPLPEGMRELWLCIDITLSNHAQKLLRLQAQIDPLTGLANRAQIHERVAGTLRSMTAGARLALVLVDIDQFRLINDTRGHAFGDLYLRQVAERLSAFAGPTRMVGRFGGDEFVLCLAPLTPREDPMHFAEAVRAAVARSSVLDGIDVATTCSVGVAVHPDDGADADGLFSAADAALDRAKSGGRNNAVRFHASMRDEASRQVDLVHSLRSALENGEIFLRYQPLFALAHGGLVGVEALAAWRTADGRSISAAEFIPAAERSGLIVDLGYWAFGEALMQRRRWREAGWRLPPLAVNVSPSQLQAQGFAEHVISEARRQRLEPGELELEITETVALHVDREVQSRVRRLAEAGVSIVIDDFGRGYSSLSHFTQLPIHKVKIDASFIRHIDRSHDKQAIVRSMLSMASGLGLYTVAEGVERTAEAAWLFEHGCDSVQGYLYARPSPSDALGDWLQGVSGSV